MRDYFIREDLANDEKWKFAFPQPEVLTTGFGAHEALNPVNMPRTLVAGLPLVCFQSRPADSLIDT